MKTIAPILKLLLALVLALAGTASWAGNGPKKTYPAKQITDAAGRVHVRPTPRISDAQRKAAAQHRKALREKAAPLTKKSGVKK